LSVFDFIICLVFQYDFFYRFATSRNKLRFLKWGWIDFVSSIPTIDVLRWGRITADGQTALEVRVQTDTVWLNLNQTAELFKRDNSVVSRHLRNFFKQKELRRGSVVAFFATTAKDGKTYQTDRRVPFSLVPREKRRPLQAGQYAEAVGQRPRRAYAHDRGKQAGATGHDYQGRGEFDKQEEFNPRAKL